MAVTAQQVKELRVKTGAGMMDCKKALGECDGDFEKSIDWLRQKGLASAQKKSSRAATQGVVESYIHQGGKIGVLVEINCETDFVARTDKFKELAHDVALHIAASAPRFVRRDEVKTEDLEREREIYRAQAIDQGKPEKIIDKIVEGKMEKFFSEACLMEQAWVKDPDKSIEDLVKDKIAEIGENISIRRYARFVLGEGLETKKEDFADEVAAMINKK